MSLKQDRTGTRTAEDLRRRINVKAIDENIEKSEENIESIAELNQHIESLNASVNNTRLEYVSTLNQTFTEEQKTRARNNIGAGNSSFSGSYDDLTNKPTIPTPPTKTSQLTNDSDFVEDADYVHTDNNYTDNEKNKLNDIEEKAQVNVIEKIKVNGVEQTITNKEVDMEFITTNIYDLSLYKETDLTILRSSCIEKNNRVCLNFVGTMSVAENTTTTLFTLPEAIRPTETKDFVVFGQTDNEDGYIGYGYVTADGLMQVRFNVAITSYIRFSFVYDLD